MEAEEMEALPPRRAFTTVPAVPLRNAEFLYISLPGDYPNTTEVGREVPGGPDLFPSLPTCRELSTVSPQASEAAEHWATSNQ